MGTVNFNVDKNLKSIIEEAKSSSLLFVKDHGVYLMPRNGEVGEDGKRKIQYAVGTHPEKDKTFYEKSEHACGGDDFCEYFDAKLFDSMIKDGATKIFIEVTGSQFKIGYYL